MGGINCCGVVSAFKSMRFLKEGFCALEFVEDSFCTIHSFHHPWHGNLIAHHERRVEEMYFKSGGSSLGNLEAMKSSFLIAEAVDIHPECLGSDIYKTAAWDQGWLHSSREVCHLSTDKETSNSFKCEDSLVGTPHIPIRVEIAHNCLLSLVHITAKLI